MLALLEILTLFENGTQGRKGELEEGFDADLVIFAPDETQLVRRKLFFKLVDDIQNKNKMTLV